MINSEFLIQYTDALYSTPAEFAPRYDEFRDMFSSGQIKSKEWIIRELVRIDPLHYQKSFVIAGAWYGTLGMMIKAKLPTTKVAMIDIDPRCEKFIQKMIWQNPDLNATTADMYKYQYTEDFVINTSCEHIPNLRKWIDIIPKGKTVILQSNNAFDIDGHVNCVNTSAELIEKSGLTKIHYLGSLPMPMYTRFMIFGTT